MQPFCFEFGDRYFDFGRWQLAFRVYSESNVYTPSPSSFSKSSRDGTTVLSANEFAWAGLQQRSPGSFQVRIEQSEQELRWQITASLPERIKGTSTYVKGTPPGTVSLRDMTFGPLEEGTNDQLAYPTHLKIPVCFIAHEDENYTFALSEDSEIRAKTFAFQMDEDSVIWELHHHEDARKGSTEHQAPAWQFGLTENPPEILSRRMNIMEREWDLQPWETREDVPQWALEICLVLNLHGTHWTGFIFNDYQQQLEIIQHVAERLDGRHILAYLPAWDGRYNYNWPQYEADEAMGGEDGLKRLVDGAHELGVHVIPQIGAQSANRKFLPPALHDSAFQDAYGNEYAKEVEWDRDRMPDTYRVNASMGHPGFRQYIFDKICGLKDRFNFDGIFLDINQGFHNDSRFHVTEGHQDLAKRLSKRFSNFLVFGETWYDGLMPAYPLTHIGAFEQWNEIFEKYCRMTYHLYHPAPGRGSTGVYDCGLRQPFVPDPERDVIPAIAFVEDTMAEHTDAVDTIVEVAKRYGGRKNIYPASKFVSNPKRALSP